MKKQLTLSEERERLQKISYEGYEKTLKTIGINYLGAVAVSAKLQHSLKYSKVATYGIYMASADLSGINVCPKSDNCKANCLMGSGHNKANRLAGQSNIDSARILKTRLFFFNKEVFMRLLIHEIERERKSAERKGYFFSIRLNCTSDINPLSFKYQGKNILEIFPDIQFYDYTKVSYRIDSCKGYKNYDITWSIDGSKDNLKIGLDYIKHGGRVAVVYGKDTIPSTWFGYKTCNGDLTDYRPTDAAPVCMLKFKKTDKNYVNGKFVLPNTDFIYMNY
jgi:hypothetical protein